MIARLLPKQDRRPHWFVDAKWLVALLFVLVFSAALLVNDAVVATSKPATVKAIRTAAEQAYRQIDEQLRALIQRYQRELQNLPVGVDFATGSTSELNQLQASRAELMSELQALESKVNTLNANTAGIAGRIELMRHALGVIEGRLENSQQEYAAVENEAYDLVQQRMAGFFADIYRLTGIQFAISAQDLRSLSAEAVVERLLHQAAGQLYQQGLAGVQALQQVIDVDMQHLDAIIHYSPQTHRGIKAVRNALWLGAAALLLLLIFFSAGIGRIFSPGLVLIMAALPGFLVFSELGFLLHNVASQIADHNQTWAAIAATLGRLLDREFALMSESHGVVLAVGGLFVSAAVLLKLVRGATSRRAEEPRSQLEPSSPLT